MSSNNEEKPFRFPFPVRAGWKGSAVPTEKQTKEVPLLFQQYKMRSLTFKNRIIVSPMCMYSAEDGFFNDWHLTHLGGLARGGSALVFTEATAVVPEGRITPYCAGIWKDEQIAPLKRIADFVHANNSYLGVQLAHAGRKASTVPPWIWRNPNITVDPKDGGWEVYGPTTEKWGEDYPVPHELSIDEIENLIEKFGEAAKRCEKSGVDVIEIHGAHGYLINSFYSPLSNKRTDRYGGSFENRTRLLIEIVKKVRSVWPQEKPIFVRVSSVDWVEGGWSSDETVELAKLLKDLKVDLIDCSSGGNSPLQKIADGPGYQVPFAEKVKKNVGNGMAVGAVGKITEAKQANEVLEQEKADFVFLARELLRNPHFPLTAAHELGVDVDWPLQYERARP